MKKYAFFDIDNTLYDGYTTSGFYLYLADKKLVPEWVYERDRELVRLSSTDEVSYAELSQRVFQLYADSIKGRKKNVVGEWMKDFLVERDRFFPWARELVGLLRERRFKLYLISAAASPSAEKVASELGIEKVYSTEIKLEDGVFNGEVGKILDFEEKAKTVHRIVGHLGSSFKIGVGDSSGDIDMLSHMDESFLYQPKNEKLVELAKKNGWNIVNKDSIVRVVTSKIR